MKDSVLVWDVIDPETDCPVLSDSRENSATYATSATGWSGS